MSAAVISPQAALEALTINDSGPSTSLNSPTNGTHSLGGSYVDHPNDDLGLPADAHVIRVPEGEQYRVRALYDFEATDESALSFNTGDVIEVLTMLPSGWWDGMLGNNRGWFPSNYVEDVDETDLEFYADAERNGAANDVLRPHHSLSSAGWGGDADGGWGTDGSSTSLDDLALELMGNSGTVSRPPLAASVGASASDNDPARRRTDLGRRDTSDFAPRRNDADPDETLHPLSGRGGGHIDAWIPSLTPDGRVYYHNTQTGEDAWEIPEDDDATFASTGSDPSSNLPKRRESRQALQKAQIDGADDSRRSPSRPISMVSSHASRPPSSALLMDDQFGIPPRATSLPPPWVARLTDDGRGWYYFNTVTGEQRREPPSASAREAGSEPLHRSSIGSTLNAQQGAQPPRRGTEWEERIRQSLAPLVIPPPQPTMAILIEAVSEALREVFDAAIAGSSAEEELLMTRETNVGFELARRHDQASVEQAASAQKAVISAVRDLVVACGYVGPLIPQQSGQEPPFDEMVRPKWAKDMSLVGSLGLLALTTHNAITGPRSEEHGSSAWTDVLRAATKLRVVVEAFPGLAHPDTPPPERDALEGGRLAAWFGVDNLGDFMSGRFGFGHIVDPHLRPLDQAAVVEVQKIKAEVEAALRATATGQDDSILEILRAVTHYRDAVGHIDIAVTIDLDGDASTPNGTDAANADDQKAYNELISKARQTLRDLDAASRSLDSVAADLFLRSEGNGTSQIRDTINSNVASILRSLQGLLLISQQQAASLEHGVVRGALGHRSPTKVGAIRAAAESASASSPINAAVNRVSTPPDRNRTHSISSTASRLSRQSMPGHIRGPSTADTHRTRPSGSEQELLEQVQPSRNADDSKRRSILSTIGSKSGHSPSASQTSLSTSARREASSSSTSLPYPHPELDATSIRSSNRASILKAVPSFLRNRSGSEIEHEDAARASKKSKKLSKILGEEIGIHRSSSSQSSSRAPLSPITTAPSIPAPMPPPAAARAGQAAWYLETDYPPGEIVFDDRGNVKAGTIRALVERLTPHTAADTAYFQAFMLTYRSFVTTDELVEHLIRRYHVDPPADLNEEQLKEWKLRKMTPIRLRVANTFKAWLDNQFMEDRDGHALDVVEEFARTTLVANGSELMSKQLLALIERRRRGDSTAQARRVVMGAVLPSPAPIFPRVMGGKALFVLDIQPLELARQLTIMEANSFQRIKTAECLNKAWQSTDQAPNIHHVTDLHNRISCWCGSLILQQGDPKSRANVLKYFIKVATELRTLNNFASMASIIAGLNLSPISRLKQSWAQLSEKLLKEWGMLEKLFDSTKNFARYKELLKMINPPCVPFFAFYQTSLVFIEDGNKDNVPLPSSQPMSPTSSGGHSMRDSTTFSALTGTTPTSPAPKQDGEQRPMLINFFKRQLTADILRDIQQYQSQPYNLAVCKPVQQYIEQGLAEVEISIDVLYELSLKVEAKQQA